MTEKKAAAGLAGSSPGLFCFRIDGSEGQEWFITSVPVRGEDFIDVACKAAGAVKNLNVQIISLEVFGPDRAAVNGLNVLNSAFGEMDFPVSWIQTHLPDCGQLFGLNIWAIAGLELGRLQLDGRIVGSYYDGPAGRICKLGDVGPENPRLGRAEQTRQVFDRVETVLSQIGMSYLDVARTWFYNDDILGWYGDFNRVRTAFYQEKGVFKNRIPASTGIGARNPDGAALLFECLAIKSPQQEITLTPLPSPLQCPALDYGSTFSRAMEMDFSDRRRITVSGTASIAPDGKTAHLDDICAQIDLTMRVVRAILQSRGMDWANAVQSIVYLRRLEEAAAFEVWRSDHGLTDLPAVITPDIVCRDDLLFEIELEAVAQKG